MTQNKEEGSETTQNGGEGGETTQNGGEGGETDRVRDQHGLPWLGALDEGGVDVQGVVLEGHLARVEQGQLRHSHRVVHLSTPRNKPLTPIPTSVNTTQQATDTQPYICQHHATSH